MIVPPSGGKCAGACFAARKRGDRLSWRTERNASCATASASPTRERPALVRTAFVSSSRSGLETILLRDALSRWRLNPDRPGVLDRPLAHMRRAALAGDVDGVVRSDLDFHGQSARRRTITSRRQLEVIVLARLLALQSVLGLFDGVLHRSMVAATRRRSMVGGATTGTM